MRPHRLRLAAVTGIAATGALLWACSADRAQPPLNAPSTPGVAVTAPGITADALMEHVQVLASDRFEGRAPGTPGEERTVGYLVEQLRGMGLAPGNPDGTYVQEVPLVAYQNRTEMAIEVAGAPLPLRMPEDALVGSRRFTPELAADDAELVFVGYGIVAPEYGWDDYKGLDVTGKTLVMLVNDPPIPDPADPEKLDESMFKGRAMTYYGRWTYKYEIASEKGAAAVLIVHEDRAAGYPFTVLSQGWGLEDFDIDHPDGNQGRVPFEGWLTHPAAERLFRASGQDLAALEQAATREDFRPVPLNASARFRNQQTRRRIRSHNVVARLDGADPQVRDEVVIYTAHWDHLGRDPSLPGDQIYNGALDNATGVAGVLELARAFSALPAPPRRSIVFLLVTAEERGLLGSEYYASHPLYPLEKTLAAINIDGMNPWGKTRDIAVVGHGMSTLDDLVAAAAAAQGRTVTPDPEPENGYYFRSDHFHFARRGVPALYLDAGSDYAGKPAGFAEARRNAYIERHYHQVSDEIQPDWDLSGAAQDLALMFRVGHDIATGERWPSWKPGSEFAAARAQMLERAGGSERAPEHTLD